ncbi:replication/maintenance protein RepL [Campylobacter estrildidarum]|uniref:ArsR family transcriptional regulator n=1 Tax=Campylobacter estrildidarum TaxID=2510189 RepID=A0A4U7BGN3_9BACT|nr:replication/maintenance protein RepL [Campylobacter estrildidarum]TKX29135.1 ArsR family transcriptional regulator [Campylobacter estrildidarum]
MNFENLICAIFGKKRYELLKFLCENADENGFIMVKISDIQDKLNLSKPTIISTFKFLEEKKLFKRLKNGLYQIYIKEEI